jgi:hypothetical protein
VRGDRGENYEKCQKHIKKKKKLSLYKAKALKRCKKAKGASAIALTHFGALLFMLLLKL